MTLKKYLQQISRVFSKQCRTAAGIGVLALCFQACSPGSLTGGDNTDKGMLERPSYNPPSPDCNGLDLTSSKFTTTKFRSFIQCLNSNGSIPKMAALVQTISEAELQPTIDLINDDLFIPDFLKSAKTWFDQMDASGDLDPLVKQIGTVLKDPDWAVAMIRMGTNADPEFLRALEKFSEKLSQPAFRNGITTLESLATSPAVKSLNDRLAKEWNSPVGLAEAAIRLMGFIQDSSLKQQYVDTGKLFLEEIASGRLFKVQDEILGSSSASLALTVSRFNSIFKVSLDQDLIDPMTSLFHYLNRPIACMKQSKGVDNAIEFIIRELDRTAPQKASDYFIRDTLLLQTFMNPFCEYPEQLGTYYPAMVQLARWNSIQPTVEMIQKFHRIGLSPWLVSLLSNTGPQRPDFAENTTGIKRLIPLLKALNHQEVLDDLILVVTSIRPEDRIHFQEVAAFLLDTSDSKLKGTSIYQEFTRQLAKQKPETIAILLKSAYNLLKNGEPLFAPFVASLKAAHYRNSEDVVRKLLEKMFKNAPKRAAFFAAMQASSQRPEFREMLAEISQQAFTGRLKPLVRDILKVFEGYASSSRIEIRETAAPPSKVLLGHRLSADQIQRFQIGPEPTTASPACLAVDLSVPIDDYRGPKFDQQIQNFMACFNSDGQQDPLVNAVEFFRTRKTQETPPRSLLQLQIDLIKGTPLARLELRDLTNRLMSWIRSPEQKIQRLLSGLPWILSYSFSGSPSDPGGPLLRPLFDLSKAVFLKALEPLQNLERYCAEVIVKNDIPYLIRYFRKSWEQDKDALPRPTTTQLNRDVIRSWITSKECDYHTGTPPPEEQLISRTSQIESDYFDLINAWDRRKTYSKTDLKKLIEPMMKRIGDPAKSDPERPFVRSLLRIMQYFTLGEGEKKTQTKQFTLQELIRFFKLRSNDARMITYIFPGENTPRARAVTSLDRLELVVVNADFDAPWPLWPIGSKTNFAIQFLTQIGDAWGDEPRELWPDEVQKAYPPGTRAPTLRDAVTEILRTQRTFENMMGFPALPTCKKSPDFNGPDWPRGNARLPGIIPPDLLGGMTVAEMQRRLFNLNQVLSIVVESLPDVEGPNQGGLKILRNLFFEVARTSPAKVRNLPPGKVDSGQGITSKSYNLAFIAEAVQLGLTRQIGLLLRTVNLEDPSLTAFFKGLVRSAQSPLAETALRKIVVEDPNLMTQFDESLIWKMISAVYDWNQSAQPLDSARLKQSTYYAVPLLERYDLLDSGLKNLIQIVDENRALLSKRVDLVTDLLQSRPMSRMTRGLFEDDSYYGECSATLEVDCRKSLSKVLNEALASPQRARDLFKILTIVDREADSSPAVRKAWDTFWNRWDVLDKTPAFQKLNLGDLGKEMVRFFEETPLQGNPTTATRFREYISRIMTSGDIDQLMIVAAKEPDEIQKVLDALSRFAESGKVMDFLQLIERNISDPKPPERVD